MRKTLLIAAIAFSALSLSCSKSGDKAGPEAAKKDIAGACECALACANGAMVDDTRGLGACKAECTKQYGMAGFAEGLARSIEVMGKVRESCAD